MSPSEDLPPGIPGATPSTGPWARGPMARGEDPAHPGSWRWALDLPRIYAFNWGEFGSLISSRNEKLGEQPAKGIARMLLGWIRALAGIGKDPAGTLRGAWLSRLGVDPATDPDGLVISPRDSPSDKPCRFLLIGDPGEGDLSQWAVRRPMLSRATGIDFAVILSDVIYPAGEALHYRARFHGPLRELEAPVYAIPGNHDWNDGSLASFVAAFTEWVPEAGDDPLPPEVRQAVPGRLGVWRDASRGEAGSFARLVGMRDERRARLEDAGSRYPVVQRAPYFAIDAGGVLLICVDNGFGAGWPIDEVQSAWLREIVAAHPETPKILLLGKPLATGGQRKTIPMAPLAGAEKANLLDDLVKGNGFIAAIGGDVHNYQRYQTVGPDEPPLIVAGGSGAYMGGTLGYTEKARGADPPLAEAAKDPVLYPTESQSEWYATTQFRARLQLAPTGIALSTVFALIVLGLLSVLAATWWPGQTFLVVALIAGATLIGLGIGLARAARGQPPRPWACALAWAGVVASLIGLTPLGGWSGRAFVIVALIAGGAVIVLGICLARAADEQSQPARERRLGWESVVVTLVGLTAIGGAAPALLLRLGVSDPADARLAALIAFPAVGALVAAAFLPYGVLARAFPLPEEGRAPALLGGLGLTYLLVLAYSALAGGLLHRARWLEVLLLVGPTTLIALGYRSQIAGDESATGSDLVRALRVGALVLALGVALAPLALHLWVGWGPKLTVALGVAAAAGTLALIVGGRSFKAGTLLVALVVFGGTLAAVWPRVDLGKGPLDARIGAALFPALVVSAGLAAGVFAGLRLYSRSKGTWTTLVKLLNTKGVDLWSVLERTEPPFFKSFLEVEVQPAPVGPPKVTVKAWGVSGFEADAERPILIDEFPLPYTAPAAMPEAATAPPASQPASV